MINDANYFGLRGLLNKFKYLPLVISFDSSTPNWYAISCSSLTLEINPAVVSDANSANLKLVTIVGQDNIVSSYGVSDCCLLV